MLKQASTFFLKNSKPDENSPLETRNRTDERYREEKYPLLVSRPRDSNTTFAKNFITETISFAPPYCIPTVGVAEQE